MPSLTRWHLSESWAQLSRGNQGCIQADLLSLVLKDVLVIDIFEIFASFLKYQSFYLRVHQIGSLEAVLVYLSLSEITLMAEIHWGWMNFSCPALSALWSCAFRQPSCLKDIWLQIMHFFLTSSHHRSWQAPTGIVACTRLCAAGVPSGTINSLSGLFLLLQAGISHTLIKSTQIFQCEEKIQHAAN